jgi:hypothetical protein
MPEDDLLDRVASLDHGHYPSVYHFLFVLSLFNHPAPLTAIDWCFDQEFYNDGQL